MLKNIKNESLDENKKSGGTWMKRTIGKLRRPKEGRKLVGVCAGLGKLFGIDARYIRLAWVLVSLFPPVSTVTAIAAYIVLGYVIPEETDYIDV